MKKITLLLFILPVVMLSQISITGVGSSNKYTQDFNGILLLAVPNGWGFFETGSNGNSSLDYGSGTNNTGNTYFLGTSITIALYEYAFGGLQSGTVNPTVGAAFTNNTGKTISKVVIQYEGETWRVGAANRPDTLKFEYSTDATALNNGTWTAYSALNYANPGQAMGNGSQQHMSLIKDSITGLNIADGATFRIRWLDANASGADDGMGVDDFELYVEACSDGLALATTSKTALTTTCVENNWTYYGDVNNKYFAVKKNGNTFNASVDVVVNAGSAPYTSTSSNGANQEHASYLIGRYWNASLTSGSISTPVDVRFYYAASDTTTAKSARDAAFTTLTTITNTSSYAVKNPQLEWFKTVGTSFSPSIFTGNKIAGSYVKLSNTYGTQNGISYVEFANVASFSGGTGGFSYGPASGSGGNGLPVTWAGIVVNKNQRENELVWKTASEQNTSHFEVESSEDGANFKTISGKILAAGNSQDLLTYSFVDNNYFPITYYRVKQIDLEGSFDYSKIVVSKRETIENNEEIFDAEVFSISNNLIGIELKNAKFQVATIVQLIDISGKVLETVSSDASIQTLDISKLQSGIYFVQVQNADKVCTKKIAKF